MLEAWERESASLEQVLGVGAISLPLPQPWTCLHPLDFASPVHCCWPTGERGHDKGAEAARQGPSLPGTWAIMPHGVVLTTRVAHEGESWPGTILLSCPGDFLRGTYGGGNECGSEKGALTARDWEGAGSCAQWGNRH